MLSADVSTAMLDFDRIESGAGAQRSPRLPFAPWMGLGAVPSAGAAHTVGPCLERECHERQLQSNASPVQTKSTLASVSSCSSIAETFWVCVMATCSPRSSVVLNVKVRCVLSAESVHLVDGIQVHKVEAVSQSKSKLYGSRTLYTLATLGAHSPGYRRPGESATAVVL
jgi:hypothetical protein